MYRAMNKYGFDKFTIEEIGGANSITELNYQEWLLVHKHNSLHPNGYNMMEGGGASGKQSKETIEKRRKSNNDWHKINIKNGKEVMDIETGEIWVSVTECAKKLGKNRSSLSSKLNGHTGNDTDLRYVDVKKPHLPSLKKRVVNVKTKEVWITITECAKANNINRRSLSKKLDGSRKNNTEFELLTLDT